MDIISTDDKTPQIEPNNELFDKILNDNHVFIEWLSHLEMLSYQQYRRTKTCDYAFSKENFFYEHVAMAFPTESPWRAKFNAEIRKMLQSGLLLKWKKVRIFFIAIMKIISLRPTGRRRMSARAQRGEESAPLLLSPSLTCRDHSSSWVSASSCLFSSSGWNPASLRANPPQTRPDL